MKKKILFCTLILAMAFVSGACNKNTETAEEPVVETTILTLDELTAEQIDIFKLTSTGFIDEVKEGTMTYGVMEEKQEKLFVEYINMKKLPDNAVELFREWKVSVNYEDELMNWILGSDDELADKMEQGQTIVQQTNKPQPSEQQQNTQKQEVTSRPITPSDNTNTNTDSNESQGQYISASGGESGIERAEDVVGDSGFERALQSEANRISQQQGIPYEQALAQVKADWSVE